MFDELTNEQVLIETIKSYVKYIDCRADLNEQDRSDLLMVARDFDIECQRRGIYV